MRRNLFWVFVGVGAMCAFLNYTVGNHAEIVAAMECVDNSILAEGQ